MIRWFAAPVFAFTCLAPWAQTTPPPAGSQLTREPAIPACAALAGATPASVADAQQSYVDQPLKQLKKTVPGLRGLEDQGMQSGTAGLPLDSILERTGGVVATMLRQMPNLLAKEEVRPVDGNEGEMGYALPERQGSYGGRRSNQAVTASNLYREPAESVFTYRIVRVKDPLFGFVISESRTGSHQEPVSADFPHSVGFGITWLLFLPTEHQDTEFRLLGRQKMDKRQTYVVAFAQNPSGSRVDTVVDTTSGRCYAFSQGVAWIDSSNFEIVRFETDLLQTFSSIRLNRVRSTIDYGKVNIPKHSLPFWLPRQVDVQWKVGDDSGGERHRYSNYHLFEATTTIHYK